MAIFISKPILWNTKNYRSPSGVRANSGYPKETGFGHEEWNNAPVLAFREGGVAYRAFHTEGVGNLPVDEEADRIFVFMYASHDGVQELVGIAGNARCLMGDRDQPERERLTRLLALDKLQDEAWGVTRVQALHGGDRAAFDRTWRQDLAWIPNWRCPANTFLWLDIPAPLDAVVLRGKQKLLTMFGRHTEIDRDEALRMLAFVPRPARASAWHRIRAEIQGSDSTDVAADILEIEERKGISETTRQRLIEARIGQAGFRRDVERIWGGACAVTGCARPAVLRASHIKAWARCDNDRERLDGSNGLLLTANLDALFDRGLISFADDGLMLVSPQLSRDDRRLFGLPQPLRRNPSPRQRRYLAAHREHWTF